jgi:hypothetical protein
MMKNLSLYFLLLISFPFLTASSCENKKENKKCGANVPCTMIYVSIHTAVKDAQGKPVVLDEVETIREKTGEVIKYDQQSNGSGYIVLADDYVKNMQNQTENFQFTGKKDGKEIVKETFVISADCCHVKKVSGKEEITLP